MRSRRLCPFLLITVANTAAMAIELPGPLVETQWVEQHLAAIQVVDVRADTRSFTIDPAYALDPETGYPMLTRLGGHLRGAVPLNFDQLRTTRMIGGVAVQKMLPERAAFEELMRAAGIDSDDVLVLMSEGVSSDDVTLAARLYWQLKYYGHDGVALLDGGLWQWLGEGRQITTETAAKPRGNWQARAERQELLASSEDVTRGLKAGNVQLLDTRDTAQYQGTAKAPYVSAYGHIPTSRLYPHASLFKSVGPAKFLSPEQLRQLASDISIDTQGATITYCNSGHLAAGNWFVLHELLGNTQTKLYDGSMHQWTLEQRPVEHGMTTE